MTCIFCKHPKSIVVDSRWRNGATERRRQCRRCNRRFSTVEMPLSANNKAAAMTYRPIERPVQKPKNYYTVYDAYTDDVLACGDSLECAEQLGIRQVSFFKAVMRCDRGESKKYVIIKDSYEEDAE